MARAWLVERFPAGFEEHEAGSSVELAAYTDGTGEVGDPGGLRSGDE